jgi:hypothetical protein
MAAALMKPESFIGISRGWLVSIVIVVHRFADILREAPVCDCRIDVGKFIYNFICNFTCNSIYNFISNYGLVTPGSSRRTLMTWTHPG